MRWIIVLGALALAGCQSDYIVLKHPQTGEIVQCHAASGASFFPIMQTSLDNAATKACADGFVAAGFKRMN